MSKLSRRDFLKTTAITGSAISLLPIRSFGSINDQTKFIKETDSAYPLLEVSGDYFDIGYTIGVNFDKQIHEIYEYNNKWFEKADKFIRNDNTNYFQKILESSKRVFPQYIKELDGIAKGSGLDFEKVFMFNSKSELDARMKEMTEENPGCSTIHLSNDKHRFIAHNEDGGSIFDDKMFMLKANPPSGISFYTLIYPGYIAGVGPGINNKGMGQSCNFIAYKNPRVGASRYLFYRAGLEATSMKNAIEISTLKERAYGFHKNICSIKENKMISIEVTPETYSIVDTGEGIYYHTNHNIHPKTKLQPQDVKYIHSSSSSRLKVLKKNIDSIKDINALNERDIIKMLASHERAPYSLCRHARGKITGTTLGTGVIDLKTKSLKIYKWNPCMALDNNWITEYKF